MHHRALVWIRYKKSELVKGVHGSLGNRVKQLMQNGVAWAGGFSRGSGAEATGLVTVSPSAVQTAFCIPH